MNYYNVIREKSILPTTAKPLILAALYFRGSIQLHYFGSLNFRVFACRTKQYTKTARFWIFAALYFRDVEKVAKFTK